MAMARPRKASSGARRPAMRRSLKPSACPTAMANTGVGWPENLSSAPAGLTMPSDRTMTPAASGSFFGHLLQGAEKPAGIALRGRVRERIQFTGGGFAVEGVELEVVFARQSPGQSRGREHCLGGIQPAGVAASGGEPHALGRVQQHHQRAAERRGFLHRTRRTQEKQQQQGVDQAPQQGQQRRLAGPQAPVQEPELMHQETRRGQRQHGRQPPRNPAAQNDVRYSRHFRFDPYSRTDGGPNPSSPRNRLCQNPIPARHRPPKSSFPRKRESRRGGAGKRRVGTPPGPLDSRFRGNDGLAFRTSELEF